MRDRFRSTTCILASMLALVIGMSLLWLGGEWAPASQAQEALTSTPTEQAATIPTLAITPALIASPTSVATPTQTITTTLALTETAAVTPTQVTATVGISPTATITRAAVLTKTITPVPGITLGGMLMSEAPRTITVIGRGVVRAQPDTAQALVGVELTAGTAVSAALGVNQVMQDIIAALQLQGISKEDIQTSGYNIYAESPLREGPLEIPPAPLYRASSNVRVVIRDLSQIGDVLDVAISAGANSIHGVSLSIADTAALASEARALAVADALNSAQEWAALTGLALGPVLSVSEVLGGAAMSLPIVEVALGGGAGYISPGEQEISMQVQMVFSALSQAR
jgi:uncharacterized protein YggE